MSRFNKNGQNLSGKQEDAWLDANANTSKPVSKVEEKQEPQAPAAPETTTKQPDEGEQQAEPKKRRGLRRNKQKGDN